MRGALRIDTVMAVIRAHTAEVRSDDEEPSYVSHEEDQHQEGS